MSAGACNPRPFPPTGPPSDSKPFGRCRKARSQSQWTCKAVTPLLATVFVLVRSSMSSSVAGRILVTNDRKPTPNPSSRPQGEIPDRPAAKGRVFATTTATAYRAEISPSHLHHPFGRRNDGELRGCQNNGYCPSLRDFSSPNAKGRSVVEMTGVMGTDARQTFTLHPSSRPQGEIPDRPAAKGHACATTKLVPIASRFLLSCRSTLAGSSK